MLSLAPSLGGAQTANSARPPRSAPSKSGWRRPNRTSPPTGENNTTAAPPSALTSSLKRAPKGGPGQGNNNDADKITTSENGDDPWTNINMPDELATGIEYAPPGRDARFAFNLVDAELVELIKIIGNITGKAFILGGKVPRIKATVYAPTKINAQEAYQVFLSVLQVNGLTVMPAGRYLKIVSLGGATAQNTPIYKRGKTPGGDQIVTRLYHLEHISADELTPVLDRFKSPEGDITVYAPTNMLIITDYGRSIQRLVKLIDVLDEPGTGEQIWIEPVNYADAGELADRITEVFEVSAKSSGQKSASKSKRTRGKKSGATSVVVGEEVGDSTISKILSDERTNSLIIVASESAYLRVLELVKRLDVAIAGEGTLHVLKLQHADAEELEKTLNSLTKSTRSSSTKKKKGSKTSDTASLFEGDVQVSADKTTNSLLVVSSLKDYMSMKRVVGQLDVMQQQVFVEAVIMEVGVDTQRDLGLSFHAGKPVEVAGKTSLLYGASQPAGTDGVNSMNAINSALLPGLATGLIGPKIEGVEDIVGVGASIPAFGVALQALQTNSDVNVLSTPNIIASDNNEATIQVGENVPISMGYSPGGSLLQSYAATAAGDASSVGNLGSMLGGLGGVRYKRQDVGLTLKITPHINDDEQVRLEIELEVSDIKSADPVAGPNISKKQASTTTVVSDQQTVVIGGLITDREIQTTKKVPVLGDIPILGFLFRTKTTVKQKQNLLIFLTPYIIRKEEDFRHIFNRKMAERREFIERWTAFDHHRVDPHLDWTRTSGVVSEVNRVVKRAEDDEALRKLSEINTDVAHDPKAALGEEKEEETRTNEVSLQEVKRVLDKGKSTSAAAPDSPPAPEGPAPEGPAGEPENVPFEMEVVE